MFHSFFPSPAFQCPFQHCCLFSQLTCSERCLDVLWVVECDSGGCLLSSQPGAGLLCMILSRLSGTRYPHQWLWKLSFLWLLVVQALLGVLMSKIEYQRS